MNRYVPPFKVHLCWFASATDERCRSVAKDLYEFLHRPLDDDFVLRPGVEIPVEVGRNLDGLLADLAAGREPTVGTRLVIALLDSGAFDDEKVARAAVTAACQRSPDPKCNEVFLPILLDGRWGDELAQGPSTMLSPLSVPEPVTEWQLATDVGIVAGRALLRRLADANPPRPKVLLSHARIDGRTLAKKIVASMRVDARVEAWLDETDTDRGEELGKQLAAASDNAIALVVRTDKYSETPSCALELLSAKQARVPILTLLAGADGEPLTSAYGGNHRTMVWHDGREPELIARCVQAWLHALYFRQYAAAALALAALPADTEILTRRPELLDVMVSENATQLIVHPDPPLTAAEATLLRTARPRVRLATPTTLFGRVLLAKDPEPPLSGMTVALSLSTTEDLPEFDKAITKGSGLTRLHLDDVLYSIVVTTVHSGSRIAYGGDFQHEGYSHKLSELLRSRRRLGTTARTQLLMFLRPDQKRPGDAARDIDYSPVTVEMPAALPPELAGQASNLWHLAMREEMARRSQARIVLGGKTRPCRDAADEEGYYGPWPGVLEETWRTLRQKHGVFVVGGFGGLAGLLAEMFQTGTVPDALARTNPLLVPHTTEFDRARAAIKATAPADVVLVGPDGKLLDIEDLARGVLADWQAFAADADADKRWSNGLTRAENEVLFASNDPTEITHLVFEGLRRLAQTPESALKIVVYHGDVALAPNVDAYAVTVTPGVPSVGAVAAIDKRMGGRLAAITSGPLEPVTTVASGGDLSGSQVLLARLDLPPAGLTVTPPQIAALAEAVARQADKLGITSIACVAFGSTMGVKLAESVRAMLDGIQRANARALRTVVFCEFDAARYDELHAALGNDVVELRAGPTAPKTDRPVVLNVEAVPVGDGWTVRATLFLPDAAQAVVPRSDATIQAARWLELRERAFDYPASLELGQTLWKTMLSEEMRGLLRSHGDRRLVVLTEENGSGLPWEFLTDDTPQAFACQQGIVRRIALTGPAAASEAPARAQARMRVLLIVNPLGDLPNTVIEADEIQSVLRGRSDIEIERLEGAAATLDEVTKRLGSGGYDILHYAGHAFFDTADPTRSGLRLPNDKVLAAGQLPATRPPRLVYLSACESMRVRGQPGAAQPPSSQSLAEALLRSGVAALVGTFFAVADGPAQRFASTTYQKIAAGQPLGIAVLEARKQLFNEQAADWGNFMLYGDDQLII